jgi:arylsulfatase A-like enzyme
VEFINENKSNPFFLYMAYSAPHVTLIPRPDKLMKYFRKYEQSEEKFNPYYSAMVESLDDGVGKIIDALKKSGLLENTIIVFTSDNGGLGLDELGPVPTSDLPLRKWKGHIYEGGIRVPAIISWSGKIKAGTSSDFYFTTTDYLPTFCDLLGITKIPESIDGKSILPLLLGSGDGLNDKRPLFWHYPHFSNQLGRPAGAVRQGEYKLVELYETGKLELYNIREDVSESTDLSGKMKDKTEEMYKMLVKWRESVNAQMPAVNQDYRPVISN